MLDDSHIAEMLCVDSLEATVEQLNIAYLQAVSLQKKSIGQSHGTTSPSRQMATYLLGVQQYGI